jgi:hypothetical protein
MAITTTGSRARPAPKIAIGVQNRVGTKVRDP